MTAARLALPAAAVGLFLLAACTPAPEDKAAEAEPEIRWKLTRIVCFPAEGETGDPRVLTGPDLKPSACAEGRHDLVFSDGQDAMILEMQAGKVLRSSKTPLADLPPAP